MRPAVTITIRKRSTGYRVAALAVDSLDHAWTVANVLARSPEYSRCFLVATAWDGAELWTVGMSAPAAPAPFNPPAYYPPTLPQPTYAPPTYPAQVIDAEPVDSYPPPALPPRRW